MAELLAPAGNTEALDAAISEGADAVYLGLKAFNARLRTSNFAWSQFEAAVEAVHKKKKKIFVTVNTVLLENETEKMFRFLKYLENIGPDGIIVQDFGVLNLARTYFPNLRVHASTQMNIASSKSANALSRFGVSRVVLARELGLKEIKEIRARTSCELEVFTHGALCVSESGLCMFSSFLGGKSANRGMCTQACRRLFEAETSDGVQKGYFFSPNDLQLIEYIPSLVEAGVNSFKIEGRMKSAEYVGTVVSAYRYVLDNWEKDKKGSIETAKRILANDFARSKTSYWYSSTKADNVLNPKQAGGTGIFLGKINKVFNKENYICASLQEGTYDPVIGDSIRLHKRDDSNRKSHKIKHISKNQNSVLIDIPEGFNTGDSIYLLQTKSMSKRYPKVLPQNLSPYRKFPDDSKIPNLKLNVPLLTQRKKQKNAKKQIDSLPSGVYVIVSTIEDLHVVLSSRPTRVILELNYETRPLLLNKESVLPFSKKEIFISLDPFLPQEEEDNLELYLEILVENGFKNYVVNNPGHFSFLRNKNVTLIAGPYLYSFNRWSADWILNNGAKAIVSPFENSKNNLENTFDLETRNNVFVTIFSYVPLFRMRFELPKSYNFIYFTDKQEEVFKALSTKEGSFVLPENPFSITDLTEQLTKIGFNKFIIDLSKTKINRTDYKIIMDSYFQGKKLPDVNRFNWRDGFYDPEIIERRKQMQENNAIKNKKTSVNKGKHKRRKK